MFVFCPCSVICVIVSILFRSCLRLVAFLFCYLRSCSCSCHVLVLFSCVKKKSFWTLFQILFGDNLAYQKNLGIEWILESMCVFAYWTSHQNYHRQIWKESIKKKVAEILKKKLERKKVNVWSLNTKLRQLEVFLLARKSWTRSPYLDSPLNSERFDIMTRWRCVSPFGDIMTRCCMMWSQCKRPMCC